MSKERWIPETDEEWRQLDESRMGSRIPFRYIILAVLAVVAACKLWLFPIWDQQLHGIYDQQQALEAACVKAGGTVTPDGCYGLRNRSDKTPKVQR